MVEIDEVAAPGSWPLPVNLELVWKSDLTRYPKPPQRERDPYVYEVTIPPEIASAELTLTGEVAALTEEAARAIERLNVSVSVANLELVSSPLLRTEAVSSSRIEGLRASHRSIAVARESPAAATVMAREIANGVDSMDEAIRLASLGPLTLDVINQIHSTLARGTSLESFGGELRTRQNWIGPSDYGPIDSIYVPPPPTEVPRLMQDLVDFAARRDLPAVAQAAIVHAQFEGIHPYVDGNGRVGRTLIHVILRQRGLARRVVPPMSAVFVANRDLYIQSLAGYQTRGKVLGWVSRFAVTATESVLRAEVLSGEVTALVDEWRSRIGPRREGASDHKLVELLIQRPILSASTAAMSLGVQEETARNVLSRFEGAGVVRQMNDGRRNRVWAAEEVFDLLDRFESQIALKGDGNAIAPTRHLRHTDGSSPPGDTGD